MGKQKTAIEKAIKNGAKKLSTAPKHTTDAAVQKNVYINNTGVNASASTDPTTDNFPQPPHMSNDLNTNSYHNCSQIHPYGKTIEVN